MQSINRIIMSKCKVKRNFFFFKLLSAYKQRMQKLEPRDATYKITINDKGTLAYLRVIVCAGQLTGLMHSNQTIRLRHEPITKTIYENSFELG